MRGRESDSRWRAVWRMASEQEREPDGGEKFGVGGALVGRKKHVGVGEVEGGDDDG